MQFITGKSDASGFDKIQKIKYPIPFNHTEQEVSYL